MSQGTRQLLPRAERQAALLTAAATAFAHGGFAGTSMDDVAAEAGVTRLIVYRHFESKEELYRAVLTGVSERLTEELVAGSARPDRRGFAAEGLLAVAREQPDAFRLIWVHAAREPQFADYAQEWREAAVGFAASLVGDTISDPVVRRWAVRVMVAYMVDAVLAWLDEGDPGRDAEFVAHATDALVAMYESWVSPEAG
jgi:AcrR family transcriptional regulator